MSQRLSGLNPLSYMGVEPLSPPQLTLDTIAPTANDSQNFNLGGIWLNRTTGYIYMLVSLTGGVANWVQLYPAVGGALTFNADVGSAAPSGNAVSLAGGTNINTAASGHTVTFNLDDNVDIAGPLTVGNLGLGVVQSNSSGLLSSSTGTDGQVLIAQTSAAPLWANLTAGANVTITNGPNAITIASSGGAGLTSVVTDSGTATQLANSINFTAGSNIATAATGAHTFVANLVNSPSVSGNVTAGTGFIATTGDVTISAGNLTLPNTAAGEASGELKIGGNRWLSNFGTNNTFVGQSSGNATLTVPQAIDNTALGFSVLNLLTTGAGNTGFGDVALSDLTTGNNNSAFGNNSLIALLTGSTNTALGYNSGSNYVGAESSNILINNAGTAAESNTIRIGTQGSGAGQQRDAFMAGVYAPNNTLNVAQKIVMVDINGKIGGLTNGTNGQILIGSTGGSPAWGNITPGANISITNTAGGITIAGTGGASGGTTLFHTGSGDATENIADTSITIAGTAPINTSGVNHTVTVGLTNGTNGQVLIGGGAAPIWATLTAGAGVAITNGANSISIAATGTGGGANTFHTDSGTASSTPAAITIAGGLNINTSGSGSTVTVATNNSIELPTTADNNTGVYKINNLRFLHGFGTNNTFGGSLAGNYAITGGANTALGTSSATLLSSGNSNTAIGYLALTSLNTGSNNTGVGSQVMDSITTGGNNTGVGFNNLRGITTGSFNTALGRASGSSLTTTDSSNICISNNGVSGDNNTIRIGTQGTGAQQQNTCYIAGIYGSSVGATNSLVLVNNSGQLGTSGASSLGNGVLLSSSTGAVTSSTPGASGAVLTSTGPTTAPVWGSATGTAGYGAFMYRQESNFPGAFPTPTTGSTYILGTSVSLVKIYDRAGTTFSSNTWTCPKTGIWNLTVSITLNNAGITNISNGLVQTPNINIIDPVLPSNSAFYSLSNAGVSYIVLNSHSIGFTDVCTQQLNVIAFMSASSTVQFSYYLNSYGEPFSEPGGPGIGPIAANSYTTNSTFITGYYVSP